LSSPISKHYESEVDIRLKRDTASFFNDTATTEIYTHTSERSTVTLSETESGLHLRIEAQDIVALRAAMNSYLRWIQGILALLEKLETS
jgi:tRNA threonylcarbamoyladenosine modification (KEOPS) complex  Pcc1 subunit